MTDGQTRWPTDGHRPGTYQKQIQCFFSTGSTVTEARAEAITYTGQKEQAGALWPYDEPILRLYQNSVSTHYTLVFDVHFQSTIKVGRISSWSPSCASWLLNDRRYHLTLASLHFNRVSSLSCPKRVWAICLSLKFCATPYAGWLYLSAVVGKTRLYILWPYCCTITISLIVDVTDRWYSFFQGSIPVMATVAVRKKVVSIDHFSPSLCFQSLKIFLFVRSNLEQLYVLITLKIREKLD